MKYFSMFSGIGGFEYGMEKSKHEFENVGFCEVDYHAISIYKRHFPTHRNFGDVTKIRTEQIPDFDFLVGGFPCQSFSVAGNRQGFDDTRGTLFFEIARVLKEKKPKYFLLENVRNLLSHDKGNTFKTIVRILTELGYIVSWKIYNSRNYGVCQNRERIFIAGYSPRERENRPKILFKPRNNKKEDDRRVKKGWVELDDGVKCTTTAKGDFFAVTTRFRCRPFKKKQDNYVIDENGLRKLTPCECELLQGFPLGYTSKGADMMEIEDVYRYRCIGNAVTTTVITAIIDEMFDGESEGI